MTLRFSKLQPHEWRYSPDQPRDELGRFGSGGGAPGGSDLKSQLKSFVAAAAVAVAALAIKRFGWARAPAWLKSIAKKSLRSAEDPTPAEIESLLAGLTPEQLHKLAGDMIDELGAGEREALLTALQLGARNTDDGDDEMKPEMKPAADFERRALPAVRFDVEDKGEALTLSGHAAVFNQLSNDLGGFREQIAAGTFTEAIASDDIRALFNHDPNFVLGRNRSGTLTLAEDRAGLAFTIALPATQTVRDLVVAPIKRGDISHMSFGFAVRTGGDQWDKRDGGMVRTLRAVRLFDISPVVYPAYPQTGVAVRSLALFEASLRPATPFNLLRAKEQLARVL